RLDNLYYRFEADINDCTLLPEQDRRYQIGRAKKVGKGKGFGQSNVWYANTEIAQKEVIPEVIKYIERFEAEATGLAYGYDEISDEVIHFEGSVTTVNVNRMNVIKRLEENVLKFMDANVRFVALILKRYMVKLEKD
ncbi:MAG: hypothetical protein II005_00570, partial [Turicibacter sp.]|nr:hypothetical protein [Turicibacter sp.]